MRPPRPRSEPAPARPISRIASPERALHVVVPGSTAGADRMPPGTPRVPADRKVVALLRATQDHDERAWGELMARFDRRLRAIARSYRLSEADIDDVLQVTWLRLLQHADSIREPAKIAGWLITTVRRESLHALQRHARERLTDDPQLGDRPSEEEPDAQVIALERRELLARALSRLPERHRRLMTMLSAEAELDYQQVSKALDMPVGSIGPIRARCLSRLERDPALRGLRTQVDVGAGDVQLQAG